MILLCTKNLYVIHDSHSPFHRKMYIRLMGLWHPCPIRPPIVPLNVYFDIFFVAAVREPALYRLLALHIPNLVLIFFSLGRLLK
jgi:hypothetical protein